MARIGPFHEGHLRDELRFDPAAFLHLLVGQRFAPARSFLLRQVDKWAGGGLQFFEGGRKLVSNALHEAVLHFGHKNQLFAFIDADEQRIDSARAWNEAADDELLLAVGAVLYPGATPLARFIEGAT